MVSFQAFRVVIVKDSQGFVAISRLFNVMGNSFEIPARYSAFLLERLGYLIMSTGYMVVSIKWDWSVVLTELLSEANEKCY